MSLAVVTMPVVTPVTDQPTAESVARRLRDMAEVGPAIANAVDALARDGWEMVKPELIVDDGFADVLLAFLKEFPDSDAAHKAAIACLGSARMTFNADLGWNANRDHPQGPTHVEAVDWWTDL